MMQKSYINTFEMPQLFLLNIGYAVHNADWNYKNVISPFARIYLVREGHASVHLSDGTTHLLSPGHLYLIPPYTLHSYDCDSHFALYYIHIYEARNSSTLYFEDYIFPFESGVAEYDNVLVERLLKINPCRELKQYDPRVYDNNPCLMKSINSNVKDSILHKLETNGILYQLLSRFMEHASNKLEITDNRIHNVLRFIRKNIYSEITFEQLTDISCLSRDHLIRLFKKEMRITPVQYINMKKIEEAQFLLVATDSPVKDIAYSLSFHNAYYFNRLFKRSLGVTPGEYRQQV